MPRRWWQPKWTRLAVATVVIAAGALGLRLWWTAGRRPGGLAQAGDSKTDCLYVGASPWREPLAAAERATGVRYQCVETYSDLEPNWQTWTSPWIIQSQFGYSQWVRASPSAHTIVLTLTLIPEEVADKTDPATWERACDEGAFDHYAAELARNLVAAGFGYAIIRLGVEASGPWEYDFVGNTLQEQRDWARCFAAEVTSTRSVPGAHFLFDWDVNACYEDIPFGNYYPGNHFVDILGIDLYDISCTSTLPGPGRSSWVKLASEPDGLDAFAAFARAHDKPMSIPEWGLEKAPNGDDPYYVQSIARFVRTHDVSFQTYFDAGDDGILPLGPLVPKSLTEYRKQFEGSQA